MRCPLCASMGPFAHFLCRVFEVAGWVAERRRTRFARVTADEEWD